nr:MAG TPA: hypothetical protein [Caudoviricetes sp.]
MGLACWEARHPRQSEQLFVCFLVQLSAILWWGNAGKHSPYELLVKLFFMATQTCDGQGSPKKL